MLFFLLLLLFFVILILVIVIVIFPGLDTLFHEAIPLARCAGLLGRVVMDTERRLLELAFGLQLEAGLCLVIRPLRRASAGPFVMCA